MTVTTTSGKIVSYDEVLVDGEWLVEMNGEFFVIGSTPNLVTISSDSGIRIARGLNKWDAIRDLADAVAA